MDEEPMQSAATKLVANWASLGLSMRPGCPPAMLDVFQLRSGFVLPSDLREFLELANGIEADDEGFSFWPLEAYESFDLQHARHAVGCPTVANPERYFVFCDYLHWSWAYAIRLARSDEREVTNRIIPIGMMEIFTVANSFTEFVELRLSDSVRLYPGNR